MHTYLTVTEAEQCSNEAALTGGDQTAVVTEEQA